jgi:hypothetical protein
MESGSNRAGSFPPDHPQHDGRNSPPTASRIQHRRRRTGPSARAIKLRERATPIDAEVSPNDGEIPPRKSIAESHCPWIKRGSKGTATS